MSPEAQERRKSGKRPDVAEIAAAFPDEDVLLLRPETMDKVITDSRLELLKTIKEEELESSRGLARRVDRKPNAVLRDLKVLYEADVIDYREEGDRKIPVLKHDKVLMKPLV